ncbi:TPA: PEP/pyruvate-binding domain-containing protein [Vibrio cholerae]|uniref:PEP/pyruvate-binding domain-containing protein n=1 Tax=Vibrio cholerae TaxID=666 RepID=UPI0011D7C084|nr:PEP/pyruvate-binding domain-containing protein [Vibrio cholerae]EGR2427794.1 sugar metabolism cluster protein [Vibrio cholerae]EGR3978654.1 sugar metabolism cluster protein [Vibrio cholerae]EJL6560605.1 sugar metabolism cluster protein [Vibrio cholerae]EJL7009415.1 sugar metabolism cluster protein [Vibrio cholerae]EKF9699404.1 sugar metabolism cluster protein [Vibrio cholerae]
MKKIVILAAGLPHLGIDPTLSKVVNGATVLDWQLNSLRSLSADVDVVLGFKANEIKHDFHLPVNFLENKDWEKTKSAGSLLMVDLAQVDELWISYGDILYHSHIADMLSRTGNETAIAYDSDWRTRYLAREQIDISESEKVIVSENRVQRLGSNIELDWATGEFVGLVCMRGKALNLLKSIQSENNKIFKNFTLPDLLELIRTKGVELIGVDVKGQWAELNEPRDLAHFVMGTKAETLARLRMMLKTAVIQDQVSFSVADWECKKNIFINKIQLMFKCKNLVVRSSACSEDSFSQSNAGAYTSLLNVKNDAKSLDSAIEAVIASYHNLQDEDQVLIQPMLTDVVMSGVVFTRTLEHGSPYLVINYEESGSTEGITSGKINKNSVFYFYKKTNIDLVSCAKIKKLLITIQEIEELLGYDALDIEFAIDNQNDVHIFQVRPITLSQEFSEHLDIRVTEKINQACDYYCHLQVSDSSLLGSKIIFGNMPDWNPAEIIGTNPGELAYSLYKYLILDDIWAEQRFEYGYRDVRPYGLLKRFAGKPYIDVRASFNSFIPQTLPNELAARLVDFYIGWLVTHPHLHDKIEFDVIPTCLSLNFGRWEKRLIEQGDFSLKEVKLLKQGLINITNNGILRVESDLNKIELLSSKLNYLSLTETTSLDQIKALLDDCKRLGTLPFSHLARAGFIAINFLKDAVSIGLITLRAQEEFLLSLNTVSHTLSEDANKVLHKQLLWSEFVKKYGHLRPGTYDITSQAYHEDPTSFLAPIVEHTSLSSQKKASTHFWDKEKVSFFNELRELGINGSDQQLESFMRSAIEGREKAKFIFSRSLSKALDGIVIWGEKNKLSRQELAELPITYLLSFLDQKIMSYEQSDILRSQAKINKSERMLSQACELPPLITSEQDFLFFTLNESHPNYISSKKVCALVFNLKNHTKELNVKDKIVMIPQADPGYDWLFGQGIAGLITMYGGANSHMAIRSAEFGLPAAIGIGENLYRRLSQAYKLELDPSNSLIRVIY